MVAIPHVDFEKFRLRTLVDELIKRGEVKVHDQQVDLCDLSRHIEATPKASLFRQVGPERSELVAAVSGSRKRVALAFGVNERELADEFLRRRNNPQPIIDIEQGVAPVQEIVWEGQDADLTHLPFHLQHELDGSVYISSALDFTIDPQTGRRNLGARRLSLLNRHQAGTNLTAPSDLKKMYQACVERGEKLAINFALGSHPLDLLASQLRMPIEEPNLIGTMRGEPVPMVKGITNDIHVPADAEVVIEGYLDEKGYLEPDGPYGEYAGYYGPMHLNPVFHVTAVTMRKDALHQSVLHGAGPIMDQNESGNLGGIVLEARTKELVQMMGIEVTAVYVPPSGAEGQHVHLAIRQSKPGHGRNAIAAVIAGIHNVKHVFVVDEDIDIFNHKQMDWAMATRFQSDRDLITFPGVMGMPLDPSRNGPPPGTKAGFDLTLPLGAAARSITNKPSHARTFSGTAQHRSVNAALEQSGPLFFGEIMEAVGTRDGREIAVALDEIRDAGQLVRIQDGRYDLGKAEKGTTGLPEGSGHDPNTGL